MNKLLSVFSFLIIGFLIISCAKDTGSTNTQFSDVPNLPDVSFDYVTADAALPAVFNDNTPNNNAITNEGATLGRVLFYDNKLSINNAIACASCHKQELSFSDGEALSLGFESKRTTRNSPSVLNMRFSSSFFWDMSQSDLETQVVIPISNHIEMGMEDLNYLSTKLAETSYYPQLFKDAFGEEAIDLEKISLALSQFIRSINSFDSNFDLGRASKFENFNTLEELGLNVFLKSNCNSCHRVISNGVIINDGEIVLDINEIQATDSPYSGGSNSSFDFANIGLDMVYADQGKEDGKFKIPSLRNLTYTAPYMHDGRFKSLEAVIEHYNSGIVAHPDLDQKLSNNGGPIRLNLSELDKKALKAFLLTLTDDSVITDEKLSDPFRI